MKKNLSRKIPFIASLVVLLFLAGCEDNNNKSDSDITGAAVSKIYRACKYQNGNFCEDLCCIAEEKCNGETAYKGCNLETGEWKSGIFENSKCTIGCEIIIEEDGKKEIELNKESCDEGWKCINKYDMKYRNSDCSFGATKKCKAGCMNDTCITVCTPGNFTCKKDALKVCGDKGESWEHFTNCAYGCYNSTCTNSTNQTNQTQNATSPGSNECGIECFSITNFHYDADGNDNNNENDEYVTIKNSCQSSCDLTGWEISDDASHNYNFGNFNLGAGNSFTLYTGIGADTASKLYWNRGSAVWNNDGDILYLKNQDGNLIFSEGYS